MSEDYNFGHSAAEKSHISGRDIIGHDGDIIGHVTEYPSSSTQTMPDSSDPFSGILAFVITIISGLLKDCFQTTRGRITILVMVVYFLFLRQFSPSIEHFLGVFVPDQWLSFYENNPIANGSNFNATLVFVGLSIASTRFGSILLGFFALINVLRVVFLILVTVHVAVLYAPWYFSVWPWSANVLWEPLAQLAIAGVCIYLYVRYLIAGRNPFEG